MISIVIPNFNGRFLLENCLDSIFKNSASPKEVIVVDNGSTDDSVTFLKVNHKKVKIVKNKKNLGFAAAANQGIKKASQNWVAIINNDVTLDKNWIKSAKETINECKEDKVGCICGTVLNKTGKIVESKGFKYFIFGKAANIDNGKKYIKKQEDEKVVFGSNGAAVIYNKKALKTAGLFDHRFFAYLEDVDLSLRLQKFGFKTIYSTKLICFHLGGKTSDKMGNLREKKSFQNWFYIFLKHYPLKTIIKNLPQICLERLKILSSLIKKTPLYRLPFELLLIFLQIMLKSPMVIADRDPIKEKTLYRLSETNETRRKQKV